MTDKNNNFNRTYDNYYYLTSCGLPYERGEHWLTFFGNIADQIVKDLNPKKVLDAGCAKGFLVEALRDRGVDAYGIDISEYAISQVREDIKMYCNIGSILEPLNEHYDLITAIEVLEHLTASEGRKAIDNLCKYSNDIIFSASPSDYKEATHFNVQPVEYWVELFARNGFIKDIEYDVSYIINHAMRFKKEEIDLPRILGKYERHFYKIFIENKSLREAVIESRNTLAVQYQKDQEFNRLLSEKEEEHRELLNLRRLIENKEQDLQNTVLQLNAIRLSLPFKILSRYHHFLNRIFPKDTYRYRLYRQVVKSGNIFMDEGLIKMIRRAFRYVKKGGLQQDAEDYNQRYQLWIEKYEPKAHELSNARKEAASFNYQPLMSVIMPVYNVEEAWLRAAIESVRKQIYDRWELCIADDASTRPYIRSILEEYVKLDQRIKAVFLKENLGISGASNAALDLATGEFVGLLDNDDELAPFALFEVVKLLNQTHDLDFIYSDEDKLEISGERSDPFFKPDFSPDLLMSMNYICHFSVFRHDLLRKIGGFRKGFEGSQDYDLILRITAQTKNIAHIPKILYHWRKIPGSASASVNVKDYAYQSACKALEDALAYRDQHGKVQMLAPGRYRIRYEIKYKPLVSIIIPTKDKVELLRRCIESIREKSAYSNYEIIVVDNNSIEVDTWHYFSLIRNYSNCRVLSFNDTFNYARLNNFAVGQARGDLLLFLNNDTEVITNDWLEEMISHAQRKEIGAVGVKLLFPNNHVQHGGVVVGLGGVAGHAFYGSLSADHGYMDFATVTRNYAAVTAACLMMRRDVFEEAGGFDEELDVAYNDVDLCLKIINHGYYIVWTPHATLYHYESASRGQYQPESNIRYFCNKWENFLKRGDPFYNPQLALDRSDFMVKK